MEIGSWKIEIGKKQKQVPHAAQKANGVRNDKFCFFHRNEKTPFRAVVNPIV